MSKGRGFGAAVAAVSVAAAGIWAHERGLIDSADFNLPGQECVDVAKLPAGVKAGQTVLALVWASEIGQAETLADHQVGNFGILGSMAQANVDAGRPAGDTEFYRQTIADAKTAIEEATDIPAVVGVDDEGGRIQRTDGLDGAQDIPSARQQRTDMPTEKIQEMFRNHGQWLGDTLGVEVVFGPVVNVGDGSQLEDRTYDTDDIEAVNRNAGAAAAGLKEAGVATVVKHFGLGELDVDTHDQEGTTQDWETLLQTEVPAFQAAIDSGADAVMVSHAIIPGKTEGPGTQSPDLYNYLRKDMGFDGLAMTDDLAMAGSGETSQAVAAVKSLEAGADMVLVRLEEAAAVTEAIQAQISAGNTVLAETIDEKVENALEFKDVATC